MSPTAKIPGIFVWNFPYRRQSGDGRFQGPIRQSAPVLATGRRRRAGSPAAPARDAVKTGNLDFGEFAVLAFIPRYLSRQGLHAIFFTQILHFGNGSRSGAVFLTTVKQNDGFGDVDQFQGPVQCGITTTTDNEIFSPEQFRVFDTVKELGIFELLDAVHFQGTGLECADTCRDENGFGDEFLADGRFQIKTPVFTAFDLDDFFSEMEGRPKGSICFIRFSVSSRPV